MYHLIGFPMKTKDADQVFWAIDEFIKKLERKGFDFDEILAVMAEYISIAEEYL